MRRFSALVAAPAMLILALTSGCASDQPVVVSREALGTVVKFTAYGENEAAVRTAIDDAFAVMSEIAAPLDAYEPESETSVFNADPYTKQPLPPWSAEILDATARLTVGDSFSPTLMGVSRLYAFEGSATVPVAADLGPAVAASQEFVRADEYFGYFERITTADGTLPAPGLDFGGAAKGLALDYARESLRASGVVTGAIVSSGSSTVTLGAKPDGSVWRIGIEDPRDTDRVVATFSFEGDGALSTSGDYQRFFEADGVRYHHILDPATGLPARGLRSLTVAGTSLSGLDSDILSTALFVRGTRRALDYAGENGLALYIVDDEGRAHVVPAPDGSGLVVAEVASATP